MDRLTMPSLLLVAGWPSDTMTYWAVPREPVGITASMGVGAEGAGRESELEETWDRSLSRVCLWSTSRSYTELARSRSVLMLERVCIGSREGGGRPTHHLLLYDTTPSSPRPTHTGPSTYTHTHICMPTFALSSSVSMGSTDVNSLPTMEKSNLAYLLMPQELQRNGSFSS